MQTMGPEPLHPIECRVLEGALQGLTEELSQCDLEALMNCGLYRSSLGNPPHAQHFRRSMNDGTCLHLIVERGVASLHCDQFDPHRDPMSLVCHLLTEARQESISATLTAWSIARLLIT
jgi:hypothetical protein